MAPPLETDLDEAVEVANRVVNGQNNGLNGHYVSYSKDLIPPQEVESQHLSLFDGKFESTLEPLLEESPTKSVEEEPKYAQVKLKRNNVIDIEKSMQESPSEQSQEGQISSKTAEIETDIDTPMINRSITDDSAIVVTGSESVPKSVSVSVAENPGSVTSRRANATEQINRNLSTHSGGDALQSVITALYCKIVVILGLAFPMAEVISNNVAPGYYQLFYVYLFLMSLLFLLVTYIDLWKSKAAWAISQKKRSTHQNDEFFDGHFKLPRPRVHYGSFYLRLGAVLFGIGSMIYSGIEIGMFFELNMDKTAKCSNLFSVIRPLLQMIFVFVQMYFIFLNQKMNIYKNRFLSRFGLMHMIATNLCVWLNVLILETNHEIVDLHSERHHRDATTHENHENHGQNTNETEFFSPTAFDLNHLISQCQRNDNIMSNLLAKSGPFLFPCTIEYTLICAAVLFAMWKNIPEEHEHYKHHKRRKKISRNLAMNQVPDTESGENDLTVFRARSAHHYSVDCANANTGLFSGIFVMVLVIISLIVFFVLITNDKESKLHAAAITVASMTELALYLITSIAVLIGMCQMRKLWYDNSANLCLDNLLLVVAQTGVFIYSAFCIIGAFFQLEDHLLAFLASLATLVQTTLQTVFILDASSRFACTNEQVKRKPGRQVVTFLLVCNLAMWAINTLETNRADSHPIQVKFYGGDWAWPIITHVSMPLAIFYRFHSTVCLCEIWKKSFKFKSSA